MLRLVRPAFPAFKTENAAFRDAASPISFVRDAHVLIETYDMLADRFDEQIDTAALAPVRQNLVERKQHVADTDTVEEKLRSIRTVMDDARQRAATWRLSETGFKAVSAGLRKTYARAREAMAKADKSPTAERFHDWRKRVKYHWYHTRLLKSVWPGVMRAHGQGADDLGDILGDHHDLAVFRHTLSEDLGHLIDKTNRQALEGLAMRRQKSLEGEAFALGARLFAEPPKALAKRWGAYWAAWNR